MVALNRLTAVSQGRNMLNEAHSNDNVFHLQCLVMTFLNDLYSYLTAYILIFSFLKNRTGVHHMRQLKSADLSALALAILTANTTLPATALAAENHQQSDDDVIEEVIAIGVRDRLEQSGSLMNAIQKTEVVGSYTIEKSHAANLTEAIAESPGVRVSNECSMCGVKRIMLNGLRGEHSTILVDGLPTHTMISGYYAVDAIASTGIEQIEIARGAGASLIAPEAMGGTINIVTLEPVETGMTLDVSGGENGLRQIGLLGTGVSEDGSSRITLIAQTDTREQFDADDNGVSESPFQENRSTTIRISQDIGYADNLVLRYSNVFSEIFGGPVLGDVTPSIGTALNSYANAESDQLFEGDDVNNRFIGNPWETTEWVETRREEFSTSWLHEFDAELNMMLSYSYAEHIQDSFYEGFDYYAEDEMNYLDARFHYRVNDEHLLVFGIDRRTDELRSRSIAGEASNAYISDSFDYEVRGIYMQDTWAPNDQFELSLALRLDQAEADFIDDAKPGVEIEETILSPRLDSRYFHDEAWTSRFSAGRGYRAPLSFFETDHGILDGEAGYAIDVDKLERSLTFSYALSFEGEQLTSTLSAATTAVENLAGIDETDTGVPLLTQQEETSRVTAYDIATGHRFTDEFLANLTLEQFVYNDAFKSSYAIAPAERRVLIDMDYDLNGWEMVLSASWTAGRDLDEYGYEGTDVLGSDKAKVTDAPAYWIVNTRIAREIMPDVTLYAGANNLLDYTQAGDEGSPLTWDAVGDSDAGYDVAYIYGPLRGREAYLGIKWAL